MDRRQYIGTLASSTALLTAGCLDNPFGNDRLDEEEVFAGYRYEADELVVEFRDGVEVESASLVRSGEEYERIDNPLGNVRFPVLFPARLDTHLSSRPPLRVEAETADGRARISVWDPIHASVRDLEPGPDGRAQFQIENTAIAPLLVRFVSVFGDVPRPAADPTTDAFEFDSFRGGPGVVGTGENSATYPERRDLIVPGGEQRPFETTYRPFADGERSGSGNNDGEDSSGGADSEERSGTVAVVQAAGGVNSYGFTY